MIRINLDRLLADRGITQTELARLTGIRPSTILDTLLRFYYILVSGLCQVLLYYITFA